MDPVDDAAAAFHHEIGDGGAEHRGEPEDRAPAHEVREPAGKDIAEIPRRHDKFDICAGVRRQFEPCIEVINALRENPGLSGKVVLSVTIAPSGKVTDASIVSSELGDPELERKILARVMLLDFGPKDVPTFTYPNYPIRFQPPN